jgi:hypothetical protein
MKKIIPGNEKSAEERTKLKEWHRQRVEVDAQIFTEN